MVIRRSVPTRTAGTAELLGEARRLVRELSPTDVHLLMMGGAIDVVIDVRERDEWNCGHLPDAIHAPRGMLEWFADPQSCFAHVAITDSRSGSLVVVCATGSRSLLAARTLLRMGYLNVASMRGGYQQWVASGLPSTMLQRPPKCRR